MGPKNTTLGAGTNNVEETTPQEKARKPSTRGDGGSRPPRRRGHRAE